MTYNFYEELHEIKNKQLPTTTDLGDNRWKATVVNRAWEVIRNTFSVSAVLDHNNH